MASVEIKLPDIGEGVTEGELVKWLVKVGDAIKADQPLAEVMTDKATVEIPAISGGVVKELKVKEGEVVPIGKVMLTVESSAGSSTSAPAAAASAPAPTSKSAPQPAAAMSAAPVSTPARTSTSGSAGMDVYPPVAESRVLATPSTRRLAREMNVDINQVQGTGLAGRVTRDDLLKTPGAGATAAGQPSYPAAMRTNLEIPRPAYQGPAGAAEERVPLKGVRKKIAEKMQLSKQIVPHFTLMDEADVSELVTMRASLKDKAAQYGVKVTYLPFVIKSLIATMREFSMFNASIDDAAQEIVYKKYFNIGFAADTPQGLLVPVIKDADRKSILQISKEIQELSEKARAGKLAPDEMKGATISITNIGSVGGTYATPIINHPEVAILGIYKIVERPVFVNGEVKGAHMMNVTITADHRLIDGAVAANFLKSFVNRLQHPGVLMLDLI
jgi:pyruvate dehydrogenase E2 component (dihydrolipoamide acetyltransferase)